ncbi:MAG: ATP-binding protein, partial [Candidatus Hodarchaeota archaeon]
MERLKKVFGENTKELNNAIITSIESPFASTVYDPEKPIKFFVGRENEIKRILQVVQHVINEGQSKGISLEGGGGCGKSTLFGYINQIIHQGKLADYPSFLLDMNVFQVFSTYVIAPSNADTFLKLWTSIFEGLEERDYSFFEYLAFLFLAKLFEIFQEYPNKLSEYGKLVWSEEDSIPRKIKKSGFKRVSWEDIKEEFIDGNLCRKIPEIINFIKKNGRTIVFYTSTPSGTHPLLPPHINLDRVQSLPKLVKLLTTLGEDLNILDSFYCRDQGIIIDDDQAFEWFNFFVNLYSWVTGKIPCFLIGVDGIGKITGGEDVRRDYYQGFYNTLIRMRNKLKFVVFVLIGTTDDWKKMNDFIQVNSDLNYQIKGFLIDNIFLDHLELDLVQQIFKKRIEDFWENSTLYPRSMRWYPFSEPIFEYVYNYTGFQLRESLLLLNKAWTQFRLSEDIPIINDYITAMKIIRTIENDWPHKFIVDSFHEFERKILLDDFWNPQTFKTDTERSKSCEIALTKGFELLAHEDHPHYVDRARCNPTFDIIINGKKRRRQPDVYVELFGHLGPENARRVEFQVKIYGENSYVSVKELESSFNLFQAGLTDLLYLIMTGKGLDQTAMQK